LEQLKEEAYRRTIRKKVLEVIHTASIDDFANSLNPPLSSEEAWEVYRQIKDMVLDSEIIEMVAQTFNQIRAFKATLEDEVQRLRKAIDEQSNKQVREMKQYLADLEMFKIGLELWSASKLILIGKGSNDCWIKGRFTIADVKTGYDLRRTQTDEIINSVEQNIGTLLFGEAYSGKSTVLSRVMFEEITERGYVVIFGDDVKAKAPLLRELIDRVSERFRESKVLIIVDNVQRSGNEELFKLFNEYYGIDSNHCIRFLFAARKSELDIYRKALERSDRDHIKDALRHMRQIKLSFSEQDAINFLKQAISISGKKERIHESYEEIEKEAKRQYKFSRGDLFMFIYAIQNFIVGNELYKDVLKEVCKDFFMEEMEQKINAVSDDLELARAAILCSFLGMFGIKLFSTLLDRCNIIFNMRKLLIRRGFLFGDGTTVDDHYDDRKEPDEFIIEKYKVRHERWSQEFLFYFYRTFNNVFQTFDNRYRIQATSSLYATYGDSDRHFI
jgi:hypothetical protein